MAPFREAQTGWSIQAAKPPRRSPSNVLMARGTPPNLGGEFHEIRMQPCSSQSTRSRTASTIWNCGMYPSTSFALARFAMRTLLRSAGVPSTGVSIRSSLLGMTERTGAGPLHAHLDGFDLHDVVAVPAGDRSRRQSGSDDQTCVSPWCVNTLLQVRARFSAY